MKTLSHFLIFLALLTLAACSATSYVKRGDRLTKSGRYALAQPNYEKAYKKFKDKKEKAAVAMKNAKSFEQINLPRKAAIWYRKAIMNQDTFPEAVLALAYAEVKCNRLEEAKENFWEYEDLVKDIDTLSLSDTILKRIEKWEEFPGRYKVAYLKQFNSAASDFAPVYMGQDTNVVVFTSNRKVKDRPKKDGVTGAYYTNIYESHYSNEIVRKSRKKKGRKKRKKGASKSRVIVTEKYQWSKAKSINDTINSELNDGAACFSSDGQMMFFTSTRRINKNHQGTKIYAIQNNGGNWGEAALQQIVADSISVAHPSLSEDGSLLYFVSDMPGGYGGNDIWVCKNEGGNWGAPRNLGRPINSSADELYPFIRDNGSLYFASDRKGGIGGLDIYKAQRNASAAWEVENMKYPINSSADDFAIHFQAGNEKGMFTSSRRKGNDDIYRFDYVPLRFALKGKVVNDNNTKNVENFSVHVVSSDGEQVDVKGNSEGKFEVELKPDLEYIVMVSAEGYLNGKHLMNTLGLKKSRNFKTTIRMKPIEQPIELPNIFYDFGSHELREESKEALNGLVETLNDNPKITIELGSHSDFVGSEEVNKEISQKRAQSVVDYLIDHGIYWDRLIAQGYGESKPRQIDSTLAAQYNFLKIGDVLTEKKISTLSKDNREIANQINRRTEFKVISTNYKPGPNSKKRPTGDQMGNTLVKDLNKIQGAFYTIQLGMFRKSVQPKVLKNFKIVFKAPANAAMDRYTIGFFDDLTEAKKELQKIKRKGIKAIIIAYRNGKKITFAEAKKLMK
jgi:peptidoglycan-associated lipoprotein